MVHPTQYKFLDHLLISLNKLSILLDPPKHSLIQSLTINTSMHGHPYASL